MNLLTLLRPATVQDCKDIFKVHLHSVQYTCILSYNEHALKVWEGLLNTESYLPTISDPDKALWVAEYKGNIQGFFQIDCQEAQLDALYVHPCSTTSDWALPCFIRRKPSPTNPV